MGEETMTYWRFLNNKMCHPSLIWGGIPQGYYLNDTAGMLEIPVNWIDGKPYHKGYPGTPCDPEGITAPIDNPVKCRRMSCVGCVSNVGAECTVNYKNYAQVEEPKTATPAPSAWNEQKGGTHYTEMRVQPFQYSMANKLDPMQHTIIKYVSRFRSKNGVADLEKAKHTIDLLIEWENTHGTR